MRSVATRKPLGRVVIRTVLEGRMGFVRFKIAVSVRRMRSLAAPTDSVVIPRLGLGIHEFLSGHDKLVDAKAKPWHDD
jgi:hypothetical protein